MKLSALAPVFLFSLATLTACGGGSDSPEPAKDTTAPIITLNGDSALNHSAGTDYVDEGATANDATDGSISIIMTGTVDSNVVSSYTLTYSATDAAGNQSSVTRTVDVQDLIGPVITPTGGNSIKHNFGDTYTDLGATGVDNVDETVTIIATGEVNIAEMGSYTITYTATDESGNETSTTRTINVEDLAGPVITPTGGDSITHSVNHNLGDVYTDLGATGVDNVDETVTIITMGEVDVNVLGSYLITYTATDALEHTTSQTRTVNVQDLAGPVITLTGGDSITHNVTHNFGDAYTDQGAMGLDNADDAVTIITTGEVDFSVMGTYTITYTATDAAGNESSIDRTVIVADLTAPVITLNGAEVIEHNYGDAYTDQGATATDTVDGVVDATTTDSILIDKIGSYGISYTATDAAGNEAMLERIVNVADLAAPVITLNGDSMVTIGQNRRYKELGATALDVFDNELIVIAGPIEPVGTVDNTTIAQYQLTYTATDTAGNTSTLVRTVDVVEPRPFITTWKTDNAGFSDDYTIKIGTLFNSNYTVDWGDGNTTSESGPALHTYLVAGTYTVSIYGDFQQMSFGWGYSDNKKILSVEQWGDIEWLSMYYAFWGCTNLVVNDARAPLLYKATNLKAMFGNTGKFNQNINHWDVSTITRMDSIFSDTVLFNQPLDKWDVSSVVDMATMFSNAVAFDQDLSSWDISSVQSMESMFDGAVAFDQDLSSWDISSVDDMFDMLWNTSLSTVNYDALLNSWSKQLVVSGNEFAVNSQYSPSSQAARDILTSAPNNWSIFDDGVTP